MACFSNCPHAEPSAVENVVLTALILYNYLRSSSSRGVYCPAGTVDSEGRDWERQDSAAQPLLPLTVPTTGHNATTDAKQVRETFKECFCNEEAQELKKPSCSKDTVVSCSVLR